MRNPVHPARLLALVVPLLFILLTACASEGTPTPQRLAASTPASATPTQTRAATATSTPTSTASPTPTNTPTPTPTPTPTALPAAVGGDPRAYAVQEPVPGPGAACGVVDFFDFPVDPPDAVNVRRGGTDYNRYRERYNGFHAGEDWAGPNGRSLGSPVYSIGHGRVIYSHPNGWGVDKGTVIVRHTLADGSQLLSFYGHLDPPSVNFRYGDCVARGDKVGEIGDPRGRPHLHFEIRTHNPAEPGPGYWSVDPTLAGWFPPSSTIWANRFAAAPGVLWARPPAADDDLDGVAASGFLAGDVLVLLAEGRLQGIDAEDGSTRWLQPPPPTPTRQPEATPDPTRIAQEMAAAAPVSAVLDEAEPLLYAIDRRGRLQAVTTAGEAPDFAPRWQVEVGVTGSRSLYALPGGGVVVVGRREMVALDAGGRVLWQETVDDSPVAASRAGAYLFVVVGGDEGTLWSLSATGATLWPDLPAGTPVGYGDHPPWLYTRDGVYRLDVAERRAVPVAALPPARFGTALHGQGAALALADGGLLLAHPDLYDRRLLRFGPDGTLLWERSYRDVAEGEAQLTLLAGRPYLVLVAEGSTTLVNLFSVDLETGELAHLFYGGTRERSAQQTWLGATPAGALLLNIGGGHLVALDPQRALEALLPATPNRASE